MADEPDEATQASAGGTLSGIHTLTKLLGALAALLTAGGAVYVAVPKQSTPPTLGATTASAGYAPSTSQPPTRSHIQLASFATETDAAATALRQARDLLRQVCVYESRGVFATALGPMLTSDADDMVEAIKKHPTVHGSALVVAGKTYVSVGKCYRATK